jgi:dTDP-glucose pyrophosphorylase
MLKILRDMELLILMKMERHLVLKKNPNSKSNYAVTGLYFYPNDVVKKL